MTPIPAVTPTHNTLTQNILRSYDRRCSKRATSGGVTMVTRRGVTMVTNRLLAWVL